MGVTQAMFYGWLLVSGVGRIWVNSFVRPAIYRTITLPKRFAIGRMQLRAGAQAEGNANSRRGQRYGEMSPNPSPPYFDGE
jgi:hypothetical protein